MGTERIGVGNTAYRVAQAADATWVGNCKGEAQIVAQGVNTDDIQRWKPFGIALKNHIFVYWCSVGSIFLYQYYGSSAVVITLFCECTVDHIGGRSPYHSVILSKYAVIL